MRNYSEIGCLTLLGVTLTVYVAVGSCQSSQFKQGEEETVSKVRAVEKSLRIDAKGRHYFVKFSAHSFFFQGSNQSSKVAKDTSVENNILPGATSGNTLFIDNQFWFWKFCLSRFEAEKRSFNGLKTQLISPFAGVIRAGPLSFS